MKKNRLLVTLLLPTAILMSACNNGGSGKHPHKDSGISPEEMTIIKKVENIALNSRPTKITTRQVYSNPTVGVPLNYLMSATIEYGSIVEVLYSYSYEKLADALSNSFIEVESGQYYATGNSIAEIVNNEINWISPVEKALNFPVVTLSGVTSYIEANITENCVDLTISDTQIINIFGSNYPIHAVNLAVKVDLASSTLTEFDLNYETDLGAVVKSVTTYTYNQETVDIA